MMNRSKSTPEERNIIPTIWEIDIIQTTGNARYVAVTHWPIASFDAELTKLTEVVHEESVKDA